MSSWDEAKKILVVGSSGIHALETIAKLAKGSLGINENAVTILSIIASITDVIKDGIEGKVPIESVEAAIDQLHADLSANDAAAKAALDAKFPKP